MYLLALCFLLTATIHGGNIFSGGGTFRSSHVEYLKVTGQLDQDGKTFELTIPDEESEQDIHSSFVIFHSDNSSPAVIHLSKTNFPLEYKNQVLLTTPTQEFILFNNTADSPYVEWKGKRFANVQVQRCGYPRRISLNPCTIL
jgi:hypothetical protein